MRDFFKRLFGGKEPETVTLSFDSVTGLLGERVAAARLILADQTKIPMQNIRNAAAQLQLIVNTIAGAEHDPVIHPRLKSIAKNTLPQYIRAMNISLAKELPEDTEEFYPAAIDCVKNCLNSIQGPGRYLQIVFPEEMKASRTGIDAIGREINHITTTLGAYRKEMTGIHEARTLHATILDTRNNLAKANERDQRITQRIQEITGRLNTIETEVVSIPDDPLMADADTKKKRLKELENHKEEKARIYAALSMTAAHVLRKAEKIALKQKHPNEISILKQAMILLSGHEMPDPVELESALNAACPVAERMIGSGEIALKNKEERGVFSDINRFCKEMGTICRELKEQEVTVRDAQEALLAHPLIMRTASLEREKGQLKIMLEKERTAQKELKQWQQKAEEQMPVLTEEFRKKVGSIIGKNVQFQDHPRTTA